MFISKSLTIITILLTFTFLLSACGGGSSGGGNTPTPSNNGGGNPDPNNNDGGGEVIKNFWGRSNLLSNDGELYSISDIDRPVIGELVRDYQSLNRSRIRIRHTFGVDSEYLNLTVDREELKDHIVENSAYSQISYNAGGSPGPSRLLKVFTLDNFNRTYPFEFNIEDFFQRQNLLENNLENGEILKYSIQKRGVFF